MPQWPWLQIDFEAVNSPDSKLHPAAARGARISAVRERLAHAETEMPGGVRRRLTQGDGLLAGAAEIESPKAAGALSSHARVPASFWRPAYHCEPLFGRGGPRTSVTGMVQSALRLLKG